MHIPHVFRAYDIRGRFNDGIDTRLATALGRAIALRAVADNMSVFVGRDGRCSSPLLSEALIDGLCQFGAQVIDLGAVPTPMVYFVAMRSHCIGVMVTASHNPPDENGFKVACAHQRIGGLTLWQWIKDSERAQPPQLGTLTTRHIFRSYCAAATQHIDLHGLKVVVDCANGIAGPYMPALLAAAGATVVPLYCDVDGRFPNHEPDPSRTENMRDLATAVLANKADIGIGIDGDGDRVGVVDRNGHAAGSEKLLMLLIRQIVPMHGGRKVLYDVKSTSHLAGFVRTYGGEPQMVRTGHTFIAQAMFEHNAVLGGEVSGHIFIRDDWWDGFDDGLYVGLRIAAIAAAGQLDLASLPTLHATPEITIDFDSDDAKFAFIDALRIRLQQRAHALQAQLVTIDGVRAEFADGWGLARASNTTPKVIFRFEADSAAALRTVMQRFQAEIAVVDAAVRLDNYIP